MTTTDVPAPPGRRIRSAGAWCAPITGFRAIAAVLVVVGHAFLASRIFPFTGVIHVIGLIVPLFFVVSAYALYRPFMAADIKGEPRPAARMFWWRRFLRIYPLFAVALTLYLILLPGVRPHSGSIVEYVELYLFLQVYDKNLVVFSGIPAAWFLCDEVAFYLFLPGIAALAHRVGERWRASTPQRRLKAHVAVAVAMIVVGMVARTWLVLAKVPGATSLPVSNLDFYGFGILLAAASLAERQGQRLPGAVQRLREHPGFALFTLLAGSVAMDFVARHPGEVFSPFEDIGRYALYTIMVVPLMTVMVLGAQDTPFNERLGSKRFGWLATLSLHVYLWHQLVLGGFDRYVTQLTHLHFAPRVVMGTVLAAGAVVVTTLWAALLRPILDLPYRHWGHRLPRFRPASWPRGAQAGAVAAVVLLASGGVAAAFRYGGSPVTVRGGVGLVTVTHAEPGDRIVVRHGGKRVASGDADAQGALVVRDLAPGHYRVDQRRRGQVMVTRSADVLSPSQLPPSSLYAGQHLHAGLNDITTRDGTRLSAYVKLPGPESAGPYPTVVEYSAYQIGDRDVTQPASAAARAMGYATVGVNVRGTGCSAGAFDLFSPAQAADGYDVVQAVARQPWVQGNKVALTGFSYGGLAALEVASTRPPSLSGVVALSVYGDAWQAFHPGGLDNAGFPVGWMRDMQHDAEPSGADWVKARIAGGDKDCLANQAVHGQQVDIAKRYLGRVPDDGRFTDLSPEHWAPSIDVPVLVSSQFDDSTLGSDLAEHIGAFSGAPVVKLVLTNGTHGDGIAPQLLRRMNDFLSLYVADRVPQPLDTAALIHKTQPDVDPARLPSGPNPPVDLSSASTVDDARRRYAGGPPIEVLWESGGGEPRQAAAARWSTSYDAWPPPASKAVDWYLGPNGTMTRTAPEAPTAVRFETDPAAATIPFSTEGNDLVVNAFQGWNAPEVGATAGWESPAFASDTAFAGTGSIDLWVRSDKAVADLQAVLLAVDGTGHETLVQDGWLRTSYRTLRDDSTTRRPDIDFAPAAARPLVPGQWTLVHVRLPSFAQVVRAGSRLRLLVGTPGDAQVQWSFGPPPRGAAAVDIGQGGATPSRLVLSRLPLAEAVPKPVPSPSPCGSLRGQPCRESTPLRNEAVDPTASP